MKFLAIAAAALLWVPAASADGPSLFGPRADFVLEPAPGAPGGPPAVIKPTPDPRVVVPQTGPLPCSACGGNLFPCVKYEDLRNIHPCAVEKVVQIVVKDKCSCCSKCVFVKVCVPPCGCERVKRSRCGTKLKLDYGKYEVEIRSRRGVVKVDYDD